MTPTEAQKRVIKIAQKIYSVLQEGHIESVYEESMGVEFRKSGIHYEIEKNVDILYENEKVGVHRLDFVVEKCLVVELKATGKISPGNKSQLSSYLRTLEIKNGLIINFPYPFTEDGKLEIFQFNKNDE